MLFKILKIKEILLKIKDYYEKGYFVIDFDALLYNKVPEKIPINNNKLSNNDIEKLKKLYYFSNLSEMNENELYIETILYLFGIWSYYYLFEIKNESITDYEDFEKQYRENIKYPGLYQFFSNLIDKPKELRITDFDELELYLDIAYDYFSDKNYKKIEDNNVLIEGITTTGMQRYENQDCYDFVYKNNCILAVLADGMGGGVDGSVASKLAVNFFIQQFDKLTKEENIEECLKDIFININNKLTEYKEKKELKV